MSISSKLHSTVTEFGTICLQDNNVERAADWIFSHADELDQPDEAPMETQEAGGQQAQNKFRDGSESKWQTLVPFPLHWQCFWMMCKAVWVMLHNIIFVLRGESW